jgi:Zn-dependent protease
MGWSWRIGRIAGIDLYVHFTFLILLAWVALTHYLARGSVDDALVGLAFILALFGIVILHELGHALAARYYGIPTRDITLLPIGGVARLERMPDKPAQELVVALAGPAVNVVLAVLFLPFALRDSAVTSLDSVTTLPGVFLTQLFWINVMLAAFNMIPAFPMDGGRVLRALLALRMDYVRATQVAATIGQGMAFLFGIVGLFGVPGYYPANPFLLFIALFVWMGAAQEAAMVQMRSALSRIPVDRAMATDFRTLEADEPLANAVRHVLDGFQQDFPVLRDGKVAGVLTRQDLLNALARHGREGRVADAMQCDVQTADAREMLDRVLARVRDGGCRAIPVVEGGRVIGLVTMDRLSEFLMLRDALRRSRPM